MGSRTGDENGRQRPTSASTDDDFMTQPAQKRAPDAADTKPTAACGSAAAADAHAAPIKQHPSCCNEGASTVVGGENGSGAGDANQSVHPLRSLLGPNGNVPRVQQGAEAAAKPVCRIYYATRTHSQIAQVWLLCASRQR